MNGTPETTSKRTQILDAAQRRFAHYGVSKVTMDDVAADLGISKASVYYYFKTKEDVFREVVRREREEFIGLVESITASEGTAEEKLRRYCSERLQLINRHANMRVVGGIQAWVEAKPLIRDVLEEFMAKELLLLRRIIETGVHRGEFAVDNTEKTARLVLDVYLGLVKQIFQTFGDVANFDEQYGRLCEEADLFLTLILKGLTRR